MLRAAFQAHKAHERTHWTLQYVSGLAADEGWQRAWSALVPRAGQHLALLGNCCSVATGKRATQTEEFLRRCSATWDTVSIIPGPRELSSEKGAPFYEQLDHLREIAGSAAAGKGNVQLMDQGEHAFYEQDVVVIGAGGWTALHPHTMQAIPAEPIWYTPGVKLNHEHLAAWHNDDWNWLQDRHKLWALHHPTVRRIVLTHSLCTSLLLQLDGQELGLRPMTIPYSSNRSLLESPGVAKPYAWVCGAGKGSVTGMVSNGVYAAVNAADPTNTNYLPDRIVSIPLA